MKIYIKKEKNTEIKAHVGPALYLSQWLFLSGDSGGAGQVGGRTTDQIRSRPASSRQWLFSHTARELEKIGGLGGFPTTRATISSWGEFSRRRGPSGECPCQTGIRAVLRAAAHFPARQAAFRGDLSHHNPPLRRRKQQGQIGVGQPTQIGSACCM